jgi:hypothetical protein
LLSLAHREQPNRRTLASTSELQVERQFHDERTGGIIIIIIIIVLSLISIFSPAFVEVAAVVMHQFESVSGRKKNVKLVPSESDLGI